ncbi:MAG: DUF4190 domain-containing protein [Elusimicrobiota bacterium]
MEVLIIKCPYCKEEIQAEAVKCRFCKNSIVKKGGKAVVPKTCGEAIASLVSSIVGFFGCVFIGPILGIVFGNKAKKEIKNAQGALTGEGLASAGIVIGWIGIGVNIALIPVLILVAVFIPRSAELVQRVQEVQTRKNLTSVRSALDNYYSANDEFPEVGEDNPLDVLVKEGFINSIPGGNIPGADISWESGLSQLGNWVNPTAPNAADGWAYDAAEAKIWIPDGTKDNEGIPYHAW